jgi:CheY-like chemotaxis protein
MKTILVADDEYDLTRTLKAILERDGYRVETCADGREALDRLQSEPKPDLVLLDVMMPVLSGLEVLQSMRASDGLRQIPVLMIGSVLPRVDREDYGWDRFLAKPFTLDVLRRAVAQLTDSQAEAASGSA